MKIPFNAVCKHTLKAVMSRLLSILLEVIEPVVHQFAKAIDMLAKVITHVPHDEQVLDWSMPARKVTERLLNCEKIEIKQVGVNVAWSCPGGQRPAHNMKHVHDGITTSQLSVTYAMA